MVEIRKPAGTPDLEEIEASRKKKNLFSLRGSPPKSPENVWPGVEAFN